MSIFPPVRSIQIRLGVHVVEGMDQSEPDLNKIFIPNSILHDEISIFEVLLDDESQISESDSDDNSHYIGSELPGANQQMNNLDYDSLSVDMQQHSDTNTFPTSRQMISHQTATDSDIFGSNETTYLKTRSYDHDESSLELDVGVPLYIPSISLTSLSRSLALPLDLDSTKFYPMMEDSYIQSTEPF